MIMRNLKGIQSKVLLLATLLLTMQVSQRGDTAVGVVNGLGALMSKASPGKLRSRSIWTKISLEQAKRDYRGPEIKTFQTRLDHFDASGTVQETFSMRYIIDEQFNMDKKGPILFYAGNEGNVEAFYNNSGFMTETLAAKMNATVVFGEHRFYGESFPFNDKAKAMQKENLKYISVEQVMMDFVTLLESVKTNGSYDMNTEFANPRTPVYVFGGSYGGMLATWLRMKYPTTFHGAIASSAPILWFQGKTDPHAYDQITDRAAKNLYGEQCVTWYQQGFYDLVQAQMVEQTYENLTKEFNVCPDSPITTAADVEKLIETLTDNLGSMAMVNYPYETEFLAPLPAWPLNYSCQNASQVFDEPNADSSVFNYQNIRRLAAMNFVWQSSNCLNLTDDSQGGALDGSAWEIQTCMEFPLPLVSENRWGNWGDFYADGFTQYCQQKYDLTPQYDWALTYFGGRDERRDFLYATNILWFNGDLDPWHGGGVNTNITSGTTAIYTKLAAHHYDLRAPNDADTPQIKEARAIEEMHLTKWLANWRMNII